MRVPSLPRARRSGLGPASEAGSRREAEHRLDGAGGAPELRAGVFTPAPRTGLIGVGDERWVVRGADGSVVVSSVSQSQAHQLVAAGIGSAALPETDHVASFTF